MTHYPLNPNKSWLVFFLVFLITVYANFAEAQNLSVKKDLELIQKTRLSSQSNSRNRAYIYKNEPKTFRTVNPVNLIYGGLLFVYQNTISQHFSADCLYNPSCSDFSKQAVKQFGLIKGGLLTIDRLNRCTRISSIDIQPSKFDPKTHRADDPVIKYR